MKQDIIQKVITTFAEDLRDVAIKEAKKGYHLNLEETEKRFGLRGCLHCKKQNYVFIQDLAFTKKI